MQEEYIVLGKFRGDFFTQQGTVLEHSAAFPVDFAHKANIYKGELVDINFEDTFRPEHFIKLSSFQLTNVPNIELDSKSNKPFSGKRLYNLSNLILINPKVTRVYELNGKTYGQIESQAYGITERYPLLNKLDPDEPPPRPPLVDEHFDRSTGSSNLNDNSGNDSGNRDDQSPTVPKPVFPRPPDHSDGCRPYLQGCLANFWSIIGIILLGMFLVSIFKKIQTIEDQCALKERELILRDIAKDNLDSIKVVYEKNFDDIMGNSFKIYFYKNSSVFESSAKSNIKRLLDIISGYKDKKFVIEGYHSGFGVESVPDIDKFRAEHMRDTLIQLGIPPSQLSIVTKGANPLIDPLSTISKSYIPGGVYMEFNQNMRVEVKSIKP
jgi:outer membrane protein OmpA-like peptidoglycan-associated protein